MEAGEVKQKVSGSPKISIQNRGTLQSYVEGRNKLILGTVISFSWGSREARKKGEEISGKDGKYTIHHGTPQAYEKEITVPNMSLVQPST